MENAVNALRMATGMMLAVLIIALIVFVFRSVSSQEQAKEQLAEETEISTFNKRFLAFDRSSLYGTDVISAIGLAISYNKTNNQKYTANPDGRYNPDSDYSLDIEFEINDPIQQKTTYETVETKEDGTIEVSQRKPTETTTLFTPGTYNLRTTNDTTYANIEKLSTIGDTGVDIKTEPITKRKYYRTTTDLYGYTEFKGYIFKCTKVGYNTAGRVNYLRFEQK